MLVDVIVGALGELGVDLVLLGQGSVMLWIAKLFTPV